MKDLLKKALDVAYEQHKDQYRKGINKARYIYHPLEVATIVSQLTYDENVIIAALLHDTVEDTNYTLKDISEEFGDDVMHLVDLETEDIDKSVPRIATWKDRKSHFVERLRNEQDKRAYLIVLADKLANLRSLYREYQLLGEDAFNQFNMKDKSEHRWYYKSVLDIIEPYYKDTLQYKEATSLFNAIFGE